jgi:hypothetical protein
MVGKRRREAEDAAARAAPLVDEYAGWRPAAGDVVERVATADVTPRAFFDHFVARRKPVILTGGGLTDDGWRAHAWTDAHLRAAAGGAPVRVEQRSHAGVAFGAGRYTQLRFDEFLSRVTARDGDETLYLTTEATKFDAHGRLAVVCPPLTHLLQDVVLRPALMGNLVPAAVNMWFGRSRAGASSGLHHDWHDNLYALLRGRKRFALYAPSEAPRLYPVGALTRIHANGRINYAGAASRADGADARDVARVAALDAAAAEAALAAAEAAVRAGAPGARKARRAAERALERALADALQADSAASGSSGGESADEEGDSGGGAWCGQDDYVDSDADAQAAAAGGAAGAITAAAGSASDAGDSDDEAPPHFSRVDASRPDDFPLFSGATCIHADIAAGELLFLPAGWWHEVTSWSDAAAASAAQGTGTHLAVNFWFHPPDAASFDAPYRSDLWARDYAAWERDILPAVMAAAAADAPALNRT